MVEVREDSEFSNFHITQFDFSFNFNMTKDSIAVRRLIESSLNAWARRDLDGTMRFMAPGIEIVVNVDPEVAPFAASAHGYAEVRKRLQLMLDMFEFDAFVADDIRVTNEVPAVVRVRVAYFYREKTTKQRLDGRFRMIWHVNDGMIERIEELHDSHYIEAFAKLLKASSSSDGSRE